MLSSTLDKIMPFKNLPLKFFFRCINRSPSYNELQNAFCCYYSDLSLSYLLLIKWNLYITNL